MFRKLGIPILLILLLATTIMFFPIVYSQSITITEKRVEYELPYPGILPDHPLFFLKKIRDNLLDFTTRENLKKAELYLNFSDKHANTALFLVRKGKNKLAVETMIDGEEYMVKVPSLVSTSKKQGVAPQREFLEKLKLSNSKHREVIEQLLKAIPQGDQEGIEKALSLNDRIKTQIQKL